MELKRLNLEKNVIERVEKGSIAEELGIKKGDFLISINGEEIKDIIDYKYQIADDFIVLTIEKDNGEIWEFEIEKDYDEDLGIAFTNPLIDKAKSCRNKCIFCFIDQLPEGMRSTLYFKDDDSRLSFLQGNFVTLTNMSEEDIDRIIKYRLSPINISVHTTDSALRVRMLNNKNAGKIYEILKRFNEANIEMNCQIVLVPGVNDGHHLERTLNDLSKLYPNVSSVAVVPVGITKYRNGLFEINPYNNTSAKEVLEIIESHQSRYLKELGSRFVYASDEFYMLANERIPKYEEYEGFPQLENGVGLVRLFQYEIEQSLNKLNDDIQVDKDYIIATGTLAYNFMNKIADIIMEKIRGLNLRVIPIENNFFGKSITVSGLITGKDLIEQLSNYKIKDGIIIPKVMLKNSEEVFLDDVTVKDIEKTLNCKVLISEVKGKSFINLLTNEVR
jgi:putative radical SAM enzyme (TIGR03279 family)